ncbi:hypothetical protein [Methylobacterium radiotolerans]|uniref:hypothetical protein n=1 Tax=Methylobacterium radiotolerans TaxID=31998 RepID=UPI0015F6F3D4|nr:hypothetical protein [Methylobacterium radiotolerans]
MRKPNTAKAAPEVQDLRQRAARVRDAAGRFIKRSEPIEPDPVHALIEEHQEAYSKWDRLSAVRNDMEVGAPGYREAVAVSDEPGRREIAAYKALFSARPTTLAGTAALGAYLSEAVRKTSTFAQPTDGELALSTITVAVQQLDTSSVRPHPDAALIALGAEFVAAWAVEEEAPDGAGYWACNRLAQQIVQTPAVTVAGLGIKALLLARLDEDDSSPRKPAKAQGPLASHWNVLRQVQEGAARLAGATDMGIPMSHPAQGA